VEADGCLREDLDHYRKLIKLNPPELVRSEGLRGRSDWLLAFAYVLHSHSTVLRALGRPAEADRALRKFIRILNLLIRGGAPTSLAELVEFARSEREDLQRDLHARERSARRPRRRTAKKKSRPAKPVSGRARTSKPGRKRCRVVSPDCLSSTEYWLFCSLLSTGRTDTACRAATNRDWDR